MQRVPRKRPPKGNWSVVRLAAKIGKKMLKAVKTKSRIGIGR